MLGYVKLPYSIVPVNVFNLRSEVTHIGNFSESVRPLHMTVPGHGCAYMIEHYTLISLNVHLQHFMAGPTCRFKMAT